LAISAAHLYLVTTSWELRSNSFSSLFSSSDIATPPFLPCNPLPRRKKGEKQEKKEKKRREIHSKDEKRGQKEQKLCKEQMRASYSRQAKRRNQEVLNLVYNSRTSLSLRHKWTTSVYSSDKSAALIRVRVPAPKPLTFMIDVAHSKLPSMANGWMDG
jgi:hypothetical protein